jgi:hypothetical protein
MSSTTYTPGCDYEETPLDRLERKIILKALEVLRIAEQEHTADKGNRLYPAVADLQALVEELNQYTDDEAERLALTET